jgi:hypothetical protein
MAATLLPQATFAAALLDPAVPCPPGLVAWNGSDPAARWAVYRNNVVSSLIDALADTFPVVQELVGIEFFRAMAALFVRHAPPRSCILAHYGDGLPAFIARFEPARSVPYLADVAALEMARVQAFHAADAEPVRADSVALALTGGAHGSEHIGELKVGCHPSLRIVRSDHAIVSLWAAHQGQGDLSAIDPHEPETALVVRHGIDVLVLRLPRGGADFVSALRQGHGLGQAAEAALCVDAAFDLSASLATLLAHGALTSLQLPRRNDA